MALVKSVSASSPSRYLPSQAAASIVVGTVTVILLKWFVWKLLLEVDAVTVASGGSSSAHPLVHHLLGLNSLLVGGALAGGSVVLRRGHRHGRWSWRPNRAGLSRYEGPSRTTQEAPGSVPSPGGWRSPQGCADVGLDATGRRPASPRPRTSHRPSLVRATFCGPLCPRVDVAPRGWDIASPSGPAGDSAGGA